MAKIDIVEQHIADISLDLLKVLLKDKTTGKYILWATDNYQQYGEAYLPSQEIFPELIIGCNTKIIQPRVAKSQEEQIKRTKNKAEVFTASWICNQQNNLIDDAWFDRANVFNTPCDTHWTVQTGKIMFTNNKTWTDYVDARRLEVSCGEAPYLVSRYDAVTGNTIPIPDRIGLLDRKLRIVGENTDNYKDWLKWTTRAFQSSYGFEYQGDNVLLARENLLMTFIEYHENTFGNKPTLRDLKKIATIISWNIWQMDGMTSTVPFSETPVLYQQLNVFDLLSNTYSQKKRPIYCKIFDWRAKNSVEFRSIGSGGENRG